MKTCDECRGDCCKILVVEIRHPETKDDFENIKYYLFHDDIKVYIDVDDCWNVQFNTQCKYLDFDGGSKSMIKGSCLQTVPGRGLRYEWQGCKRIL